MNNYEMIIIMKNYLTEEQKNETIGTIKNYLNKNGKITKLEDLGQRPLAYEIKTFNKGLYYSFEFETEPEATRDLERMCRINSDILKFIVVRKEGTENE